MMLWLAELLSVMKPLFDHTLKRLMLKALLAIDPQKLMGMICLVNDVANKLVKRKLFGM
jgi:hypothetical protein